MLFISTAFSVNLVERGDWIDDLLYIETRAFGEFLL